MLEAMLLGAFGGLAAWIVYKICDACTGGLGGYRGNLNDTPLQLWRRMRGIR